MTIGRGKSVRISLILLHQKKRSPNGLLFLWNTGLSLTESMRDATHPRTSDKSLLALGYMNKFTRLTITLVSLRYESVVSTTLSMSRTLIVRLFILFDGYCPQRHICRGTNIPVEAKMGFLFIRLFYNGELVGKKFMGFG